MDFPPDDGYLGVVFDPTTDWFTLAAPNTTCVLAPRLLWIAVGHPSLSG